MKKIVRFGIASLLSLLAIAPLHADDAVRPQGRLTLTSNTPVMSADVTAGTTVYYTPYQGDMVPVYDGTDFTNEHVSQLSLALDATTSHTGYQMSGKLYDLFVFENSAVATLGTGPAWTSTTARGTGAGTTQIAMTSGIWTNANSIVLRFGNAVGNTVTVPANQATYVGTMYATANGTTKMVFNPAPATGGNASVLGLWNAYNRVSLSSKSCDSTEDWTYDTATWRNANASASNRIMWVDGLQQTSIVASYTCLIQTTTEGSIDISIGIDGSVPTFVAEASFTLTTSSITNVAPSLGVHYAQALEQSRSGTLATFYSVFDSLPHQQLTLTGEF